MPTIPVCTSSRIPYGRKISTSAASFSGVQVDDLRPEDVRNLEDLRALSGIGRHLHEHQLALDGVVVQLLDVDDVDELVELTHDLSERLRLHLHDDGHARDLRVLRRTDG